MRLIAFAFTSRLRTLLTLFMSTVLWEKYLTFIVWSMLLNIEHDSFSHIVNTRLIDKTTSLVVTTLHCNNDFCTPIPPSPKRGREGREGASRALGARARSLHFPYTRCSTVISQQSLYTDLYSNLLQSLCNSQWPTAAFSRC